MLAPHELTQVTVNHVSMISLSFHVLDIATLHSDSDLSVSRVTGSLMFSNLMVYTPLLSQPSGSSEILNTRRTPKEGNGEINQKRTE